eukprot:4797050-Pyramimonas_sp.AAC.1
MSLPKRSSPPAIGSRAEYILPPLLRLVLTRSVYRLPPCDWFSHGVYTASPLAIGCHAEYIGQLCRLCCAMEIPILCARPRRPARCTPSTTLTWSVWATR